MAIPVGAILHSFSRLIHPAYGHASQGGDWHRALRRACWQDRGCDMWCSFQNAGPQPPETLKTQNPYQAHFTYINVPASQENEAAGALWQGATTLEIRSRISWRGVGWGVLVTVTVCHGPLGWGQRSSLFSFKTTLAERCQDHFLVLSLFLYQSALDLSFCSHIASANSIPPPLPHYWTHPSWRD